MSDDLAVFLVKMLASVLLGWATGIWFAEIVVPWRIKKWEAEMKFKYSINCVECGESMASLSRKTLTAWKKAHTTTCSGSITVQQGLVLEAPIPLGLYAQMMQNQQHPYVLYGIAASQSLSFDLAQIEHVKQFNKLSALGQLTLYGVGDDNLPVELDNSKKWVLPAGEEGADACETGSLQHESATGEQP